jgi:hypothetical protein
MSFGLCNAPATFQALMNDVLRAYLCRFVLVFFDDILIYSSSWADHLRHLCVVWTLLRQHRLFVKRSKCSFGVNFVGYLGNMPWIPPRSRPYTTGRSLALRVLYAASST